MTGSRDRENSVTEQPGDVACRRSRIGQCSVESDVSVKASRPLVSRTRRDRRVFSSRLAAARVLLTLQNRRRTWQLGVESLQAVEKQFACFDLAQHERKLSRDLKTYSVRPELSRRVDGVFQQPVYL